MKYLPLSNAAFISAEKGFKDWLDILGYASVTVYNMPNAVREFLHWLEGSSPHHATLTGLSPEQSSKLLNPPIPNPNKKP